MPPEIGLTQPIFKARLHPHRSLSQRNFRVLMLVVGATSLAVSVPFYLMGAWPVVGFMGLDVALVFVAFRASYASAKAYESVSLTPLELHLAKVSAKGVQREWRFNPQWVRLEREEHEEFGTQKLSLVSRGRKVVVAAFLGPDAKRDFAGELTKALHVAKRGPQF